MFEMLCMDMGIELNWDYCVLDILVHCYRTDEHKRIIPGWSVEYDIERGEGALSTGWFPDDYQGLLTYDDGNLYSDICMNEKIGFKAYSDCEYEYIKLLVGVETPR